MHPRFVRHSLVVLCCLALATSLSATGWPRPKGHGFYKFDFTSIRSRTYFNPNGDIEDINGAGTLLSNYTASFYGEFGLTRRLTVLAYVPFLVRNTVNEGVGEITGAVLQPGLSNTSFGDTDLGLTYNFYNQNSWVVSGNLTLGLPTGDSQNADLLFSGDGEFNQQIRLEVGRGARRWYTTGYLGVNNRTEGFSDEVRYLAEFGYWLRPGRWLAGVKLTGIESLRNGNSEESGNGLFSNNVEYLSPQVSLTWEHNDRWGVTANAGFAVFGANVLASPSLALGVYGKL